MKTIGNKRMANHSDTTSESHTTLRPSSGHKTNAKTIARVLIRFSQSDCTNRGARTCQEPGRPAPFS